MHNYLEGICSTVMLLVINMCLKKYFTLKTLNWKIKFFSFDNHSNRPPNVSETDLKKNTLKMTAS